VFRAAGASVDVRRVQDVKGLDSYRGKVIGTATRMGAMLTETKSFTSKHRAALENVPAAYFTVGITMKQDTPDSRKEAASFLAPLCEIRQPAVGLGLFAGKVDYSKLGLLWRFVGSRDKSGEMAEGDFRNWEAIRSWAREAAAALA
jgi:menaquinone-dependent protoporphyrinogen IX oxidase